MKKSEIIIVDKNDIAQRDRILAIFDEFHGKNVHFFIETFRKRSFAQNDYFHGFLLPKLCNILGYRNDQYSKELVKIGLKQKFLIKEISAYKTVNGQEIIKKKKYVMPTSQCTVEEMQEFLEACTQLYVEYGGVLDDELHNKLVETRQELI